MSKEKVEHPAHYGGAKNPHEVYKCLEAWWLLKNAYLWNAAKYVARSWRKDGEPPLDDLKKARWYLDREINRLETEAAKSKKVIRELVEIEEGRKPSRSKRSKGARKGWKTRRKNASR